MDLLEQWVADEMKKRMNRVVGHSISLEMLDYEFFHEENRRGYFFVTLSDAEKWMSTWKKELVEVDDTLIFMNGLSEKELKELKENPNRYALLVVNHLASKIIFYSCSDNIPYENPIVWTEELLRTTGFGKYMEK